MSAVKMLILTLFVTAALATESKTSDGSNVVGSLLAAKTRVIAVNGTANGTETSNSTVKAMTKRSLNIDKSEGKSELMSAWWRIPSAIWQFIYTVFLSPILSAFHRLLAIFGLDSTVVSTVPLIFPSTPGFSQGVPQLTTPMTPMSVA